MNIKTIDIKTLHIGAHVECEGRCARIEQITTIHLANEPMEVFLRCGSGLAFVAPLDKINPIPITPELLTELGFEKDEKTGITLYIRKDEEHTSIFRQEGDHGWDCALYMSHRTCKIGNVRFIKYLHEAESFLALHNAKLIVD